MIGATACTGDDSSSQDPPTTAPEEAAAGPQAVDGKVLRHDATHDYEIASSVTEAASQAEVAAAGTVVSWSDGRQIRDGDELIRHAVLEVEVESTFVSPRPTETIFIEIDRGGTLVDERGQELELPEGSSHVETSVRELRKAAPSGVRLIVLGVPALSDEEMESEGNQRVIESWSSADGAGELISPIPQGLLLEDSDQGYVSGIAEQSDVELGRWPAARGERPVGLFQQLVDELTEDLGTMEKSAH